MLVSSEKIVTFSIPLRLSFTVQFIVALLPFVIEVEERLSETSGFALSIIIFFDFAVSELLTLSFERNLMYETFSAESVTIPE